MSNGVLCWVCSLGVAVALAGCMPRTVKDGTFQGLDLSPKVSGAAVTVAELDVSPVKVMGRATGSVDAGGAGARIRNTTLESEALARALRGRDPMTAGADVLVGVNYHYERSGDRLTVTAIGYPARYKNFRPNDGDDAASSNSFSIGNIGGMSVIGFDPNTMSIESADGYWIVSRVSAQGTSSQEGAAEAIPAAPPVQTAPPAQAPQPAMDEFFAPQQAPVRSAPAEQTAPQTITPAPIGE